MQKRRVLLVCSQHLFGEGIETVLRAAPDIELVGPWDLEQDIWSRITEAQPDVVILADENPRNDILGGLTTGLIERYPDLSVIRLVLTENVVRAFSTHLFPATGIDLLQTIRGMPAWEPMKSPEIRGS